MRIRAAIADQDGPDILRLYRLGVLSANAFPDDNIDDLERLADHYLADGERSGFWLAEASIQDRSCVVGMVGVLHRGESVAEIRRLRVDPDHRMRGIGTRLMEQALSFCRDSGCLKVVLDTWIERAPAIALFERFGFQLNRSRKVGEKTIVEFYIDLYREHDPGSVK
ncbi:MAG: GNAT family N-acetyltransferase [Phycisphaerales bacterium]